MTTSVQQPKYDLIWLIAPLKHGILVCKRNSSSSSHLPYMVRHKQTHYLLGSISFPSWPLLLIMGSWIYLSLW